MDFCFELAKEVVEAEVGTVDVEGFGVAATALHFLKFRVGTGLFAKGGNF